MFTYGGTEHEEGTGPCYTARGAHAYNYDAEAASRLASLVPDVPTKGGAGGANVGVMKYGAMSSTVMPNTVMKGGGAMGETAAFSLYLGQEAATRLMGGCFKAALSQKPGPSTVTMFRTCVAAHRGTASAQELQELTVGLGDWKPIEARPDFSPGGEGTLTGPALQELRESNERDELEHNRRSALWNVLNSITFDMVRASDGTLAPYGRIVGLLGGEYISESTRDDAFFKQLETLIEQACTHCEVDRDEDAEVNAWFVGKV